MNHNAPHAFVAVNYIPKLGLFGLLFHFFSIVHFLQINLILYLFFLTYQVDSWDNLQDDCGNTLHIGKLEYKSKHEKKPGSFLDNVFPRDVKSALCLLVNQFLEQPKIKDKDSNISESLMSFLHDST
jgi:hypothetical protein